MIPREKNSRNRNNVTNLDEVRQAKARALEEQANANTAVAEDSDTTEAEKVDNPHGNRRFDAEKVARIKAAIAAGEYEIDPERIADKFIEHDRNQ